MPFVSLTRRRFAALLPALPALAAQSATPRRLRRSESFFGLHFDLHPSDKDKALGRDVSEEMIETILKKARPDYVQYDAKGHVGWVGWPSRVGPSAPGIVKDSLELWRRVTARRGVALFIHFSGVWDSEAVKRHPKWARIKPDGTRDDRQTSTYGPYVDQLMLPQLREAASTYDLDGVWVDGECWATNPDYWPGGVLPKSSKDPGWLAFLERNREQFRTYVRHYVDELHKSHPKFQVASNWLYSTMAPEEPTLPVDFLSGDFLGNASISTARLEARYLAQTGKAWDLMAWGFQQAQSNAVGHVHKPAAHLQQEASVVLAQGGGFQIYYQPTRSGYFDEGNIETMSSVGAFCRARQAVSHKSETVPQIGVVFSKETLYGTSNKLFGGWGKASDPARGWMDAMIGAGWSVDVLPDWKLKRVAAQYPLIVLPDWTGIGDSVKNELIAYARGGGKLVVSGARNAELFASEAGVELQGKAAHCEAFVKSGILTNVSGLWQDVKAADARVVAQRYAELDSRTPAAPAAVVRALGQGQIVLLPGPLGAIYAATHAAPLREFLREIVAPHFKPLVEVEAPPAVEVALRRKDGKLLVHLLNSTNMQVAGDYATTDFVPSVGPIRLKLGAARPQSVELVPDGRTLPPRQFGGSWMVEIPSLHIHSVAVISQ